MGYLGRDIQYGSFAKQTLTANSSTTVFTLSNGVADANNLLVSIGGIIQEPNVAYTAIGTVITFATAPVTNDPIFITFLGMETTTAASARDDVTYQIGTGNGTTTPLTLSMSAVNSDAVRVSLNGVVQTPWTDFTASGTTLTFSTAPDATNEILVYYIGKEDSISDVATGSVTAAKLSSTGTLPAWNGSNITGIDVLPYSKFNDLKTSLSLIGFRRSQHHGTSNLDLPNGFIDQFEDQTNVDDDASVNELYNATGDYYAGNFPDWETGNRSSLITVTTNVTLATGTIGLLVDGVIGATNLYFTNVSNVGKFIKFDFLSAKIIVDAGWIQNDPRTQGTWKWQGSTNDSTWVDLGSSFTLGTAENLVRQTFTAHLGSNTTAYRYYRLLGVGGNTSDAPYVLEAEFKVDHSYATDMTLISESETAATAPEKAYVTLFNEPVDSVTVNTDIMAWVSRSNKTITATNASNVLNATAHGLTNGDRVILSNSLIGTDIGATQLIRPSNLAFGTYLGAVGGTNYRAAQGITLSSAQTLINKLDVVMGDRAGTPTGVVTLRIETDNGSNTPSGTLAHANATTTFTPTADRTVTTATFASSFPLSSGTKYWLVFIAATQSGTNRWALMRTEVAGYAGGNNKSSANGGSSWVDHSSRDLVFQLYSYDVPRGLNRETVYHVVNKTANTFQVAATNGGAAVTFTDDGSGTNLVRVVTSVTLADKGDYGTGKTILAGTADISGQPTGTDIRLIVQTKNNKETRLHGTAVQYGKKDA